MVDVTAECEVASITAPTATDNCGVIITSTTDAIFPITDQATTLVTWTYDDGNGNTSTQTQNVIIDDVTAPVADVATLADVTAECEVASIIAPTATDNCVGAITATTDATFPITDQATTVVTWTYDDGNGNTSTQIQNVIIDDITAPIADVATLADLTAECEVASITSPTATDNCGATITGTTTDPLTYNTQGTHIITWSFDDGNGNVTTETQNVVIDDVTAPVADVATLADVTAECEVASITAPTATDNCEGVITGTTTDPLAYNTQGTHVITWSFDDGNGNVTTETQNVVIDDVTAPVADVATLADVTAECSIDISGSPTLVWGPMDVNNSTETINLNSNEFYELYINHSDVNPDGYGSIKFIYTDGTVDEFKFYGNGSTGSGMTLWNPLTASYVNNYTVGIHSSAFMSEANTSKQYYVECSSVTGVNTWIFRNIDTELSSIELADNASWQGLLGSQVSLIPSTTSPTATDNCEGVITGTTTDPLAYNTQGTHVITWSFDDGNGNVTTETQNVVIDDVTAPVADVATLADVTAECEVASITAPTATDNCGVIITSTTDAIFPITDQATTLVTWTYDDGNGNTSTQTQNVIIDDVTAPVADVATLADVTAECEVASIIAPTATDNCVGAITATTDATFPITDQATTVVTWTYDDGNGNTSTQIQNVIIDDITAPIADVATLADLTAECEVVSITAPTATDNCGATITGTTTDPLTYNTQGTHIITWSFDDGNGNMTTETQDVIINDITAPVADVATLADVTAECEVASITAPTATDNCEGVITGTTTDPLAYNTQGTHVITWSFDDGNGNVTTETQNVVIDDVTAPVADVATLADVTAECEVTLIAAPTATDNCGAIITGTTTTTFPITDQDTTVVTWTYDDGNANISIQIQKFVKFPITNSLTTNICFGDSLFAEGVFQTSDGVYVDTLISASGCDSILTTTLNVNALPNVDAGVDQDICDGESVTLNGSGISTSGNVVAWDPTHYNNGYDQNFFGIEGALYDSNPSLFANGNNISVNINGTVYNYLINNVTSANNSQTGAEHDNVRYLYINNLDGTSAFGWQNGWNITINDTYSISSGTYIWDNNITNATAFNPTATTTYTVTATDTSGCSATDDVEVTVNSISITSSSTNVACNGSADGTATAIPPSNNIPSALISFTNWGGNEPNDSGGEDYAHFTNNSGQWNDHRSTHSLNHVMEAESDLGTLSGYSYLGTYQGHYYYNSTTSATWLVSKTAAENAGGYLAVFSDLAENNFVANLSGAAWIGLYQDTSDPSYSEPSGGWKWIEITGQGGAYSYSWSDGQSTVTATGLAAGNYSVIVTDANGCTDTSNVTITEPTALTATTTATDPTCNGSADGSASVTATGGTGTLSYLWDDATGQTTAAATGLAAGTYNVTVTDANGCTITQSNTLGEPTALIVSAGLDVTICAGDSVTLNGSGAMTYAWDNGVTNATAFTPTATTTYIVIGTDANGCIGTDSVDVTVNALPIVDIVQNDTTICQGDSVELSVFFSDNGSSNFDQSLNNGLIAYYPFNGNVNDESGNGNNGTNNGASLTVDRFGNVDRAYSFDGNDDYIQSNLTLNSLPYTLRCLFKANINSGEQSLVDSDVGGSYGNSIILGYGSGNDNIYVQYHDGSYQSSFIYQPNIWYDVVATFENGIVQLYIDGVFIGNKTYNQGPIDGSAVRFGRHNSGDPQWFNGSLDDIAIWDRVLNPQEIQNLYNSGSNHNNSELNHNYSWSNGESNEMILVAPNQTTTYNVTVTDTNGCIATDAVDVTVNALPNVDAGADLAVCDGDSITLNGSGADSYLWNNGVTDATSFIPSATTSGSSLNFGRK